MREKGGDYEVRNKILILLDTWNEAFSGVARKYPHYNWAYQELTVTKPFFFSSSNICLR